MPTSTRPTPSRRGWASSRTPVTRFNGETCTSVNGVLVEGPSTAARRDALIASPRRSPWNPYDGTYRVGPLFSQGQARVCGSSSPRNGAECCPAGRSRSLFSSGRRRGVGPGIRWSGRGSTVPHSGSIPCGLERRAPLAGRQPVPLSDAVLSARAGTPSASSRSYPRAAHLRERRTRRSNPCSSRGAGTRRKLEIGVPWVQKYRQKLSARRPPARDRLRAARTWAEG